MTFKSYQTNLLTLIKFFPYPLMQRKLLLSAIQRTRRSAFKGSQEAQLHRVDTTQIVPSNLLLDGEINIRIGRAPATFGELHTRVLTKNNNHLTVRTKVIIYQTCVDVQVSAPHSCIEQIPGRHTPSKNVGLTRSTCAVFGVF